MAKIEEKVEGVLQKPIEDLGYQLYDVEYSKEGKDYYLRVYIDKEEGIDLNDCEKVSNAINGLLDELDYLKEAYFLEVSSPGIERTLRKDKHFQEAIGEQVIVKLFKPVEEKREWIGLLTQCDTNKIVLEIENHNLEIDRNNVAIVKIKCDW